MTDGGAPPFALMYCNAIINGYAELLVCSKQPYLFHRSEYTRISDQSIRFTDQCLNSWQQCTGWIREHRWRGADRGSIDILRNIHNMGHLKYEEHDILWDGMIPLSLLWEYHQTTRQSWEHSTSPRIKVYHLHRESRCDNLSRSCHIVIDMNISLLCVCCCYKLYVCGSLRVTNLQRQIATRPTLLSSMSID